MSTTGAKPLILREAPGIALRHMGDPRNRREAEYIFQTPPELRETVERYSFVIENTSGKGIIALSFGYGFPRAGQASPQMGTLRTSAIQQHLLGPGGNALMSPGSKVGFCMALGQENFDFKNGIRRIQPSEPPDPRMTPEQQQQRNQSVISRLEGFDRLMKEADHWEVEIEGAIFADGTFVGTNRRNFFEQSNATFTGAREMVSDLLGKAAGGATHADLVAHAKTFAVDFREMLKPFGGRHDLALKDTAFLAQFAKGTVARRFTNLSEEDGRKYLRHGQQNWGALRRDE